jgi:predicted P-loop ATPase
LDFDAVTEGLAADDAWKLRLDLTNTGVPKDKVANWDLIRNHDPVFGGLFFNRFSLAIETRAALPWREIRPIGAIFNEVDEAQLRDYIEREYRIRPTKDRVEAMVRTTAQERWVNPVLDYLNGLTWDGTSRIETALPGVRPTAYTRMVSRKSLVAAVARVFEPGIKWDHTLVLYGSEGLGKSWWIEKMATVGPPEMGRSNYSASLTKIDSKDTLIQMNMNWIMVSDEGHSMRKADNDALKEFLTKTKDLIRMPYDRDTHSYPRSCVIWSTTNDETFLRRQEGNRRFLIVHCQDRVDFGAFDAATVDQIWAEAVYLFKAGEGLFLDLTEAELAAVERERYTEEDAIAGMIDAYVSMRVPANWDEMTREARAEWKFNRDLTGFDASGDHTIDRVCTLQIYAEALGQDPGRHQRKDLLEIAESLKRMGWVAAGRHHFPPYGRQLVYARPTEPAEPEPEPTLDELL